MRHSSATKTTRCPTGVIRSGSAADGFYFELEGFLDNWRRQGIAEKDVRAALERAARSSSAMEDVGRWLKRSQ
jgi:hypothetical protein